MKNFKYAVTILMLLSTCFFAKGMLETDLPLTKEHRTLIKKYEIIKQNIEKIYITLKDIEQENKHLQKKIQPLQKEKNDIFLTMKKLEKNLRQTAKKHTTLYYKWNSTTKEKKEKLKKEMTKLNKKIQEINDNIARNKNFAHQIDTKINTIKKSIIPREPLIQKINRIKEDFTADDISHFLMGILNLTGAKQAIEREREEKTKDILSKEIERLTNLINKEKNKIKKLFKKIKIEVKKMQKQITNLQRKTK